MAGLSPADIAAPIRLMFSDYKNVRVLLAEVSAVDPGRARAGRPTLAKCPTTTCCCAAARRSPISATTTGRTYAPSLKTLEDATAIRAKVLLAFEEAERISNNDDRKKFLTFAVVGGGPTGVELAGAIGEMSRFTLARDFKSIDASSARVFLIEAGPRILSSFSEDPAARAVRDLENLGVQVWTSSMVTAIDADGRRDRIGTVARRDGVVGGGRDRLASRKDARRSG